MSRERLHALYREIDARNRAVASTRADWPCRRGCDACCRFLAGPPVFTRLEWEELWRGFVALEPETRAEIRARVKALDEAVRATPPPEHISCPMLELQTGACRVYAHRPGLCRTYGFYAGRDAGNWCAQIEREIVPAAQDVMWGNQDAVDAELARLGGEPIDIAAWFDEHPE